MSDLLVLHEKVCNLLLFNSVFVHEVNILKKNYHFQLQISLAVRCLIVCQ